MPQSAPICHNCTKKYSKDPPTIPILLNCGHTYCEGCITRFGRLIKGKGNITCPDCAEYHYIESLKSIKQLQINAHIYGIITAPNRRTENAVDAMVQHNELATKLTDLARQQSSDEEESEVEDKDDYTPCCECKGRSSLQCKNCGSLPYCTACSDKAHKLVALQSHRPELIKPKSLFDQCQFHPDAIPTQCLEHDGKPVCPQCPSTGETIDLVCEPDQMDDLIQKHNLALEKLEETDQNIATDLIPMVEQDFLRLKSEVRKEFGYFHGVLQAREQALLGALDDAQSKTTEPLLNYRSEIVKTKKTARKNFNWIQRHKNSKNALIEKQSEVQTIKKGIESMKCSLIVQSEKRPTLSTKKGMLSQCINEFCKLNIDDVHNYNMDTVNSTVAKYNEEKYDTHSRCHCSPSSGE
ncbi:uncharacterized RING finger protein ZK945.4-like [Bolinopsis microptera]|uniref:uncharacterized RING finger protein ZK945.4-like n=1 Tax=Bolinopsis microptera TaxID=2820187 RepID=UPI00307A0878